MRYRTLGKTGFKISEISLGTWQLGARWGDKFDDSVAEQTLEKAVEQGINFFDTADVYSDGLSERAIGKVLKKLEKIKGRVYVATKCGRRLKPHTADGYSGKNIRKFVEDSLRNMALEKIDLIQLHCPPTEVYYRPEVFDVLEALVKEGKIAHYGVSVEKVEEALKAIEYPGVSTVQIIFNMFRQRPAELFFEQARKRNVGIIVRVPLASGLLAGKFAKDTIFKKGDHRFFNREGAVFDKGETFAGLNYEKGLEAVEELKALFQDGGELAQHALRWILMFREVSCIIPGASGASQVVSNVRASALPALSGRQMQKVRDVYQRYFKSDVHHRW